MEPKDNRVKMTFEDWRAEAKRRFGDDLDQWAFICPACKHVATIGDWKKAGAPQGTWAFSCVGRFLPKQRKAFEEKGAGPCNYAGGGLFKLNPVVVVSNGEECERFDFAPAPSGV